MIMDRYIKYKDVVKLYLFNDVFRNNASSIFSSFLPTIPSVVVNAGGSNYNASNLGFKIDGGGGSGLLLSGNVTSGAITSITVNDGGSNYSSAPNITTTSGVNSISVNNGGSGYGTLEGQVVISIVDPGDGEGFRVGTVSITSGAITSVSILSNGQGYTRAPTLSITNSAGGSGAVLTCNIGSGARLTAFTNSSNAKIFRFNLNGQMNNIILSKHARLVLESSYLNSSSNNFGLIRVVTSTEDKQFDSSRGLCGHPILYCYVSSGAIAATTIYNTSENFHSISIPNNFLQKQFIEIIYEAPFLTTAITTSTFNNNFYLALKIIDVDPELSEDRPQIDMDNYNSGNVPLRIYS